MAHVTAMPVLDPRGHIPPADFAAMSYLAGYGGATRKNYANLLKTFFEWCAQLGLDPLEATRPHLELYVRHLEHERGNHPSTIGNKVNVVKRYYEFAAEDGHISKSPAVRLRAPKYFHDETLMVGLDRSEVTGLLMAARAESPDVEALVVLMVKCGLRVSEAIGVRIEHFGDQERAHTVLRVVGKGNKAATMPLPPQILRSLRAAQGERTHGVLCLRTSNGLPFTPKAARKAVARLARTAGISKRVGCHTLRHAFVTGCLDAGATLRHTQVAARHADPATTVRYDRARLNLDQHPAYLLAGYYGGA